MADIVAARDPYEAQRLRTAALQEKEAALRISDAERTIRVNESNDAAAKIMASAAAAGQPLDMQFISKVIADTGASPDFVTKNALNSLGLDEKMAAKLVKDKVRDLSKAATDLPSFNKYLAANFDPNQEDNIVPTVVQTKNGLQVMYGGQPLQGYGTYKNLNEVVADVKGKIEGDPLGAAVTIANLDKVRAQADEARSKSVSNQAYADWIKRDRPTAGKTAPTLTDVEKIAYNKAIDAIANLGPDATQQQIASEYRRFGLDPARFGVQGLPSWTPTEAGGLAPSAAGFSKTIPKPNVTTRQPSSALPTQPSGNFVRERQSNGTYKYRDLDTNKLYSTEEYNRIISR
jgi:hypothetical protein